jgi:NTE family protein
MKKKIKILIALLLFFFSNSFTQTKYTLNLQLEEKKLPFGFTDYIPANKPKIAFAMSGGGARGLSQIGILKAFEESNIKPDLIIGTSMGSIVGGMYSAGYDVEQIDSVMRETNWDDLLALISQSNRRDLFVDQKVTEDKAIFSLRLDGLSPVLPTAFNDGQKLSNYLNVLAFNAPLHPDQSFDRLKIKFRAVCTDLYTGDLISLDQGSLSNALRASSSVTFYLAPVKKDSLLLVDGGLVANIPVDVAKQNGGDFVIAINTTSDLWSEEYLDVPWIVADQIVSIPMRQNNNKQLSMADFVITAKLNGLLSTDFNYVDSLILLGYNSAKEKTTTLKAKIDSVIYNSLPESERYFFNIKMDDSLSLKEKSIFYAYELMDSVSNKKINYDLYRLYETGDYKKLSVEINNDGQNNVLSVIKEVNPIIKNIDIIGISLIHSNKISEIFSTIKDKPFSRTKLSTRLLELVKLYRSEGYSLAEIQSVEFNSNEQRLKIFVDEGIISRIDVEGNEKTNSSVITREFNFSEGDVFKISDFKNGLTNLRSTKLFDNIDIVVKEENGQNILIISVVERPSSLLRISFRSDNEYRTQLGLDLRDENVFGTGTELGLILFGGLENRAAILEQKANRIFNTYFTYKINAFYKFNDVRVYNDVATVSTNRFSREETGAYRQIFYGLSFGIGTQVGRFGNLIFEGKYQFDEIKNNENIPTSEYKTKIVSLKISSTVDTQDKYPFPEYGVFFTGFYETALSILGGETGFSNIGFEYKNYFPISSKSVISPKISFGFADKTLPLSEHYSLGGQESFFGMHENEYRGRQRLLTSLMFRYKLPVKIFFDTYVKVRYDLGSVWDQQEQIRFKDLKHGIGSAIAFDTPIGPAEFAVGRSFLLKRNIPENPISWGDYLFYFSIGYYY